MSHESVVSTLIMPSLVDFQKNSVNEIKRRVKAAKGRGIRLALADEVGLGKTHVIAGVTVELIREFSELQRVYYFAPSLEVAAQNGPKLAIACGKSSAEAKQSTTRLTLLPFKLSSEPHSPHLVSLTPGTSFNPNGRGTREERAFLYEVFRVLRERERKRKGKNSFNSSTVGVGLEKIRRNFKWSTVFYRPLSKNVVPGLAPSEQGYENWKLSLRKYRQSAREVAIVLEKSVEFREHFARALERLSNSSFMRKLSEAKLCEELFKKTSSLVGIFRYQVALEVLKTSHKPDILLFDEWHKYQTLLKSVESEAEEPTQILEKALRYWRDNPKEAPRLCLFVSATPFDVSLETIRDSQELGGLMQLSRVMDRKDATPDKVEELRKAFELAWQKYRDSLMKGSVHDQQRLRAKCNTSAKVFSDLVSKIIIRTERPPMRISSDLYPVLSPEIWQQAQLPSLRKIVNASQELKSGTDAVALWAASSHFPSMHDSYKLAEALKAHRNAPEIDALSSETHWKRERLIKEIRERWGASKGESSKTVLPPLWISPLEHDQRQGASSKLLIFSSWKAVPREVSFFLNDYNDKIWGIAKFKTPLRLGKFPVAGAGKNIKVKTKESHGWRVFYPSLYCRVGQEEWDGKFIPWIIRKMKGHLTSGKPDGSGKNWVRVQVALDMAYAHYHSSDPYLKVAAEARNQHFNCGLIDWETEFYGTSEGHLRRILRDIVYDRSPMSLPGAQLMSELSGRFGKQQIHAAEIQKDILNAARAASQYMSRDFAQRVIRTWDHIKNAKNDFGISVILYCESHHWGPMLKEYFELLWEDHKSQIESKRCQEFLVDFQEAMGARSVDAGGEWYKGQAKKASSSVVQPFVESGESGKPKTSKEKNGQVEITADEDDLPDAKTMTTTRRRKVFNSPFLPLVLVSTSIGQEGVDFHRYCDTVIHWNPPSSPLALEQREGRVDRYRSYSIRRAMAHNPKLKDGAWVKADGLSPYFCIVDENKERVTRINSQVWVLPYSREARVWQRCMERLHYFRLFIGSPDPAALEAELQESLAEILDPAVRKAVLDKLWEVRVRLRPPARASKKSRL